MIIGIDFGTCFSSVTMMNGDIPLSKLIHDPNGTGIPSVFMYSAARQKELYGYECISDAESLEHSKDVIQYLKRMVRENPDNLSKTVMSGGKAFEVRSILEKYLTYVIAEAERAAEKSGEFPNPKIEEVVITVPIGISSGQMAATDYNQLLVDTIAKIRGLPKNKIHILHEPVAAAIAYLYQETIRAKFTKSETILVFDLGGGTLDVTIVEYNPNTQTYEIKVKEGDLRLGGNEWDEKLAALLLRKAGISRFDYPEEEAYFRRQVPELKCALSKSDRGWIQFQWNSEDADVKCTRLEFENETKELLDRAIAVTKKAIGNFPPGLSGIDKIILVGGSCNMPKIKRRLVEEFSLLGEEKILLYEPSYAISKGAGIYAKLIARTRIAHGIMPQRIVKDIVTHTYGFDIFDKDRNESMIYNLLFKGTPYGADGTIQVKSDTAFIPIEKKQQEVEFIVYESDAARRPGEDGNLMSLNIGEENGMKITIPVPHKYRRNAREYGVYATFRINNEILELIITDKEGNQVGYDRKAL